MLDEVSYVIHHFRPQPDLFRANCGDGGGGVNISSADKKKKKKKSLLLRQRQHGFSSVHYYVRDDAGEQQHRMIRFTYNLDRYILLVFDVRVVMTSQYDDVDGENHNQNDANNNHGGIRVTFVECCYPQPLLSSSTSPTSQQQQQLPDYVVSLHDIVDEKICRKLSSSSSQANDNTKQQQSSLFAIISDLLYTLQHEIPVFDAATSRWCWNTAETTIPTMLVFDDDDDDDDDVEDVDPTMMNATPKTATTTTTTTSSNDAASSARVNDVAILLMRCAANSRKSGTLCSPVPQCCCRLESGDYGEVMPPLVLQLTDQIIVDRMLTTPRHSIRWSEDRRRQQSTESTATAAAAGLPKQRQASQQQQQQCFLMNRYKHEFQIFFMSLPWIQRGSKVTITTSTKTQTATAPTHPSGHHNSNDSTTRNGGGGNNDTRTSSSDASNSVEDPGGGGGGGTRTIHLCLDLVNTDASSATAATQPSPDFTQRAAKHGTLTVYHGTPPDHCWSILTYGLQNLSLTALGKNGAMMGKGVYLTTSYDVAAFFAKTGNTNAKTTAGRNADQANHYLWWQHPAFVRLFCNDDDDDAKKNKNTASFSQQQQLSQLLHEYTMSCYTVFEATILAPPLSTSCDDDDDTANNNDNNKTRRDGKYYVVPNGDDIQLTKLHITIQLMRKRTQLPSFASMLSGSSGSWWSIVMIVAIVVAAYLRSSSSSSYY